MAKIQMVTVAHVCRMARIAIETKTLQAMQRAGNGGCQYRRPADGSMCAIGSALSPSSFKRLHKANLNSAMVQSLLSGKIIKTDDPQALMAIQEAHDCWSYRNISKAAFLKVLRKYEGAAAQ